ncbi:Lipase_3 domain-containing protein [Psidium guajava]|nr:Lipase_3 domain-containing protein [Psidium guajava]
MEIKVGDARPTRSNPLAFKHEEAHMDDETARNRTGEDKFLK